MRDVGELKLVLASSSEEHIMRKNEKTSPFHGVTARCEEKLKESERIAEEKCMAATEAKETEQNTLSIANALKEEMKNLTQL
eukprot:11635546-Ditylum_brightwellii.AAC.1